MAGLLRIGIILVVIRVVIGGIPVLLRLEIEIGEDDSFDRQPFCQDLVYRMKKCALGSHAGAHDEQDRICIASQNQRVIDSQHWRRVNHDVVELLAKLDEKVSRRFALQKVPGDRRFCSSWKQGEMLSVSNRYQGTLKD